MKINSARPQLMHIDLNSCFATIEQQSRPLLRNRPVAVVNRRCQNTSIVTASYEAKSRGVKVGMKLTDAHLLCPDLVALESDPPKYRWVYHRLMAILEDYSPTARMKSIDEGVIDFADSPPEFRDCDLLEIGREIKTRIKREIGEYMRCNVGIGTNRFLAKTAAGLDKPDGLTLVDTSNLRQIYERLKLEDLTGIAGGYSRRLRQFGILTPLEFLNAREIVLERQVFRGKCGRDWSRRLRGYEVDGDEHELKSVGRQFVLDERGLNFEETLRRFHGLCEDVVAKLRSQNVKARAVRIYVKSHNVKYWQNFARRERAFDDEATLFETVRHLFEHAPLPAFEIGVTCYGLSADGEAQLMLFGENQRTAKLTAAIDQINLFYGAHTVHSADTLGLAGRMRRKIPFGSTRYL